jgi:hypothetical protein
MSLSSQFILFYTTTWVTIVIIDCKAAVFKAFPLYLKSNSVALDLMTAQCKRMGLLLSCVR